MGVLPLPKADNASMFETLRKASRSKLPSLTTVPSKASDKRRTRAVRCMS